MSKSITDGVGLFHVIRPVSAGVYPFNGRFPPGAARIRRKPDEVSASEPDDDVIIQPGRKP
ncbi:MAG TPA: hypothetical protein VJ654_11015 [Noviherbaspirillum sp.]|nr:hypothetical protein [Noviherbaspirillum sp.]